MSKRKESHARATANRGHPPQTAAPDRPPVAERPPAPARSGDVVIQVDPKALQLLAVGGLVAVAMLAWAMGWLRLPATPAVDVNSSLWLILFTGFLAGGLSCLAVQGGLLAATIAQREQALMEREARLQDHAMPVAVFLAAKVVAYTLLGAVLGYVGSFISLSPAMRGVLQVVIGVFMVVVAMQLLDVHPFFRRFTFQPPKSVQRMVRRQSKRGDALGPAILGALTVLIPCGVTQAMELVAMATGSPAKGAAVMFAFTLGTVPLFFILGLAATRLSMAWQKGFRYTAVAVILVLAVVSIVGGLRLTGRLPVTAAASAGVTATAAAADPAATAATAAPAGAGAAVQEPVIEVRNNGYVPDHLTIKAGAPARLKLVTDNVYSCARAFTIPDLGVQKVLPATGTEYVDIPPQQPGQLAFVCSMGMYGGVIEVVP
jgi:uncharacterized protein